MVKTGMHYAGIAGLPPIRELIADALPLQGGRTRSSQSCQTRHIRVWRLRVHHDCQRAARLGLVTHFPLEIFDETG
jgi:hypothetical protein